MYIGSYIFCRLGLDVPRWDKQRKEYVPVKAPQVVLIYNKHMDRVDVIDQTIEYYRTFQKTRKWTVKVLIHLLDLSVANAWRQYKIDQQSKDLLWFRLDLADTLLNCPEKDRQERESSDENEQILIPGRYKPPPSPSAGKRHDGYDHLPLFDDKIQTPRCCRMENCKSRSKIYCTKCKVYLCLSRASNCFYTYHKK